MDAMPSTTTFREEFCYPETRLCTLSSLKISKTVVWDSPYFHMVLEQIGEAKDSKSLLDPLISNPITSL